MTSLLQYSDQLRSISEDWDKAELAVKQAEQVSSSVVFPSIKELRYAGRRIVDALNTILENPGSNDRKDIDSRVTALLADAQFDCYRARHDAIDVATATISMDLDLVTRTAGIGAVTAFPQYTELLHRLTVIRNNIASSRQNRDSRESIYKVIEDGEFPIILKLYQDFREDRKVILAAAALNERRRFVSYIAAVAGVIIGVAGLIASILTLNH